MAKKYKMQAVSMNDLSSEEKEMVMRQISTINNIVNKHQYLDKDAEVYMYNDIRHLVMNDTHVRWPTPPSAGVLAIQVPKKDTILQQYRNMFKSQINEYIKYSIEIGDMIPYEELLSLPLIDITKSYQNEPKKRTSSPEIYMYEDEIDTLRNHGWYSMIPCFEDCVIKINKKRYLHVKTLGIDIPSQFIKLRLEQYIGSKNEWNKLTSLTVSIHFQDASETGLPCTWEFEDITLYEEQLSKYIPHMKWNEKQINMWNDLFGIENINDLYAIILDKPPEYKDDLDDDAIAIIYGSSDLRKLKEECGPFMHIIASGQEAKDIFEKSGSKNLFIEYLKAITLINYQLYAHRNTTKRNSDSQIVAEPIVNSESDTKNGHNSIKRLIGTITITSEQPPKLPTEESIANYKKLSWPCKGGVRHMKSGKVVPYASHTKHRHIDTNDTKEGM